MKINRKLSKIRIKALLLGVIPAGILALILLVYVIASQLETMHAAFMEKGRAIAKQAAASSVYGVFSGDSDILRFNLSGILEQPDVTSIRIENDQGDTVIFLEKPLDVSQKSVYSFVEVIESNIRFSPISDFPDESDFSSAKRDSNFLGKITVTLYNHTAQTNETKIYQNSLIIMLIGLFFTALISIFLSRGITRPISLLTQAVLRMKHGDLSVRLPEQSRGELLSLEEGFNSMARELNNSQESLQYQIQQATSDLVQSMEAIEIQNVELDLAKKRAIKANQVKSEFLANISHEIRTPLNGILGFTSLLDQSELTDDQFEYVKMIESSSNNLLKIINQILDYSELEYGVIEPVYTSFNLEKCLEDPVSLLAPLAHEKRIELLLTIYSDVPRQLIGDETRIRQIFVNLLGNAIKFTSNGEIIIRVMLEHDDEDNCDITIAVSDTGIGIDASQKEQIFSTFQKSSSSRNGIYEGTGLGLSISKKLAEAMNGRLTYESSLDVGSTFKLSLNLKKDFSGEIQPTDTKRLSSVRIGLFDDHDLTRYSLKSKLEMSDAEVVSEGTIEELESTGVDQEDLILIGLESDSYTDGEILDSIATFIESTYLPVILLVSCSERKILSELSRLRASRILSKPIKQIALDEAILSLSRSTPTSDTRRAVSHSPRFDDIHILIADDNEINLRLIEKLLERTGATVHTATNGKEALDLFFNRQIDLIIIDVHMPVMDGIEAVNFIRKSDHNSSVPIIALTADAVPAHRDNVIRSGVNEYLVKPIDDHKLWSTITRYLDIEYEHVTDEKPTNVPHAHSHRDTQAALSAAGGNRKLADELFTQFISDLHSVKPRLIEANRAEDWKTLYELIHKIHGSSAICGTRDLTKALKEMELNLLNQQTDGLDKQIESLLNEIHEVISEHEELGNSPA